MSGAYWSILLFFLTMVVTFSIFKQQESRAGSLDINAWLLTFLLVIAVLSISSFIAFIFLGGIFG